MKVLKFWGNSKAVAVGTIVMFIVLLAGVMSLQRSMANQFRQSVAIGNLGIRTTLLYNSTWEAIVAASPRPDDPNAGLTDPVATLAAFDADLADYQRASNTTPNEVRGFESEFLSSVEVVNRLLHEGRGTEAFGLFASSPAQVNELERNLAQAADEFTEKADRAQTYTTVTSVLAIALVFGFVITSVLLFARSQRRIDIERAEGRALADSEARFRSLVQNSAHVISVLDQNGIIRSQSSTVETILGYGRTDLLHSQFLQVIHPQDQSAIDGLLSRVSEEPGAKQSAECRLRRAGGDWMEVDLVVQNLLDDPHVRGIVITCHDIGERKALEHQLTRQATLDSLTALPNRALFKDRLTHALERGLWLDDRSHVLLFLDLDDFKTVNDSLGHLAGDDLLVAVAERLRACVRPRDTVARFGGDEFAILLEHVEDATGRATAERILASFAEPFLIEGRSIQTSISIGVVSARDVTQDASELIRDADTAMYMAKARGKGRVEVFTPSMHEAVLDRLDLEADMRDGIQRGEFSVYYQPLIDFASQQIAGLEALVRWQHPRRGMLEPSAFISIAEETGLILPLGTFVLTEACRQVRAWQQTYAAAKPLYVTVNLSAKQLMQPKLVQEVRQVLSTTELPPGMLILEITETVLADNGPQTIKRLQQLRELGVKIAIDDFGTGYSSLSYLQQFPVDIVKIDKSFVDGITNGSSSALPDAIVSLARALNLRTVAEGVERLEQVQHLSSIGCDVLQGFYFARPLTSSELEKLMAEPNAFPLRQSFPEARLAS